MDAENLHFDSGGRPRMVDISGKKPGLRTAVATGSIHLGSRAWETDGLSGKGPVETAGALAGIQAVKRTWELIPLCHPLPLERVDVFFERDEQTLSCRCAVAGEAKTGYEMEALVGVSVALLTVYDMLKATGKDMVIRDVRLVEKTGGKSGEWRCEQ